VQKGTVPNNITLIAVTRPCHVCVISHKNIGFNLSGSVWFGLFVHPFGYTCKTGHVDYRLQFICYSTTYNIWTSTQYIIINNNTKSKDQLEVDFVTTSRYMCIYVNITKS